MTTVGGNGPPVCCPTPSGRNCRNWKRRKREEQAQDRGHRPGGEARTARRRRNPAHDLHPDKEQETRWSDRGGAACSGGGENQSTTSPCWWRCRERSTGSSCWTTAWSPAAAKSPNGKAPPPPPPKKISPPTPP